MKKLILGTIMSVALVFTGCKSIPTPAEIETASYAIGVSTAMVCNMTKISDVDRQVIIDIVEKIKYYSPKPGETLVDAWTDIAKTHIQILVDKKEITEEEGVLILKTFDLVVSACDYMIRVRWPEVGKYTDLVVSVSNGFCDGFLTAFKPANTNMFSAPRTYRDYDVEAYNYLINKRK